MPIVVAATRSATKMTGTARYLKDLRSGFCLSIFEKDTCTPDYTVDAPGLQSVAEEIHG
jgi:hypothetical protein